MTIDNGEYTYPDDDRTVHAIRDFRPDVPHDRLTQLRLLDGIASEMRRLEGLRAATINTLRHAEPYAIKTPSGHKLIYAISGDGYIGIDISDIELGIPTRQASKARRSQLK